MRRLGWLSTGTMVALATLGVVGVIIVTRGGAMFSPGPLNADGRDGIERGGVASHAGTGGNCAACHAPPWSRETMANRCLNCHDEVRHQMDAKLPMHGRLSDGMNCRLCHSEHNGAHALLTDLSRFDHDCAAFRLTGKHRSVDCTACHANNAYKGTPQTCAGCHASRDVHQGKFGTDCAQCHTTSTWSGASFRHTFPLDHHNKKRPLACATCHVEEDHYRTYTCYGCHAHEPAKMAKKHVKLGVIAIDQCASCHQTGRKHERRGGGRKDDLQRLMQPRGN